MRSIATLLLCSVLLCLSLWGQERISVQGKQFIYNNKELFLIGTNTPWENWNDFGGNYNPTFWDEEFARLAQNGVNSSRIWISCDAAGQPFIDEKGNTHPASQQFWSNLDDMLAKAKKHGIFIMATTMSFDHLDTTKPNNKNWLNMITCTQKVQRYIDTFLIPLVKRYEDNPYLFSIDLCNEPEWMHEHTRFGGLSWEYIQMFVGMCSAAIHESKSPILVSVGSAAVKWSCDKFEGNIWSDVALQDMTLNPHAYLDYWQIHYYEWTNQFSNPFHENPEYWGLNDKPCIIGETPGNNEIYGFPISYDEIYTLPYNLGYNGVFPWTSNGAGTGNFGTLKNFGEAAKNLSKKLQSKSKN